jgi:hypothetical protein
VSATPGIIGPVQRAELQLAKGSALDIPCA